LEDMRDCMIVIFRKDFEGLVFKVAPVKTRKEALASIPPADMSTLIPPQHAIYFEGTAHENFLFLCSH
jgi:hypothetical protein